MTAGSKNPEESNPAIAERKPGLFPALGAGLVTGAADDNPSGIATYRQVGAQFGYGLA